MFHCYNCNESYGFKTFLKKVFPELYDQYIYDSFGYSKKKKKTLVVPKIEKPEFNVKKNALSYLERAGNMGVSYEYCLARGMSTDMISKLYYTENFKAFVNTHLIKDKFANINKPDERLVIPFFNENKELVGMQGRSLDPNNPVKYITIKLISEDHELVFGMDTVDKSNVSYVFEGPLDSMFIDNGVAFAGPALASMKGVTNRVLVWDNEPRNKQINEFQLDAILDGESVVIWPKLNTKKDVNDMILSGIKVDAKYLADNTYRGIEAQLAFDRWNKHG